MWERQGDELVYIVKGSGFLHHMVRNLVGTLIETGRDNIDQAGIIALFSTGVGRKGGPTAPAKGLTLESVEYSNTLTG